MIIPEIKEICSADVNLHGFQDDGSPFCLRVDIHVGIKGEVGADYFSLEVCNLAFIQQQLQAQDTLLGHGLLIMDVYDFDTLVNRIHKLVASCSRRSWVDFAADLSKHAYYEFDNYQP